MLHRRVGIGLSYLALPLVAGGSYLLLKKAPTPFLYVGFVLFTYSALLAFTHRGAMRILYGNIALCTLILTVFEGFFIVQSSRPQPPVPNAPAVPEASPQSRTTGTITEANAYFLDNFLLGYGPRRNVSVTCQRFNGDQLIYDTRYTIDTHGLRTGAGLATPEAPAIAFFGDSFTFGEGVHDDEPFPFRIEAGSKGRWKALNFGFQGYGPHQMLAWLEGDAIGNVLGGSRVKAIVYLANEDQPRRGAGRASWDVMGPRYRLRGDRVVRIPGHAFRYVQAKVLRKLNRSYLWTRLYRVHDTVVGPEEAEKDMTLFLGMMREANVLAQERFHAPFVVLLYWRTEGSDAVFKRLRENQIRTVDFRKVLPELFSDPEQFEIFGDGHPNASAHHRIAQWLVQNLDSEISKDRLGTADDGGDGGSERNRKDFR